MTDETAIDPKIKAIARELAGANADDLYGMVPAWEQNTPSGRVYAVPLHPAPLWEFYYNMVKWTLEIDKQFRDVK